MKTTEELKAEVNARLYRCRNGMTVDTMTRMEGAGRGRLLNYGVSLADIRTIAEQYAPCQPLANTLFDSNVRDHRLAAVYIADPALFDRDKAQRWMRNCRTVEIADCAAQALLCKVTDIIEAAAPLIGEDVLTSHAAVMSVARAASSHHIIQAKAAELLSLIEPVKERCDHTTLSATTFMLTTLNKAGYTALTASFIDSLPPQAHAELEWLKQ